VRFTGNVTRSTYYGLRFRVVYLIVHQTNTIMNLARNLAFVLLFLLSVAFIPFHHGWADYDQNTVLDFTGTIQQSTYENPHAIAKVSDKKKTWNVVLAPVSRLQERGVSADMLKKGTSVRVVGYPHREIKDEMRAERIFINGNKYELRR
jgi:hypothetical protein